MMAELDNPWAELQRILAEIRTDEKARAMDPNDTSERIKGL